MKLAGNKKKILLIYGGLILAAAVVLGSVKMLEGGSLPSLPLMETAALKKKVEEKEGSPVSLGNQKELDFLKKFKTLTYEKAVAFQDGAEDDVQNIISKQHGYLNDLAGYGGADVFNGEAESYSSEWNELKHDIEWLRSSGFAASRVWNDMDRAKALAFVAVYYDDSMSLRYLHRIFHDLDVKLNDYEDKDNQYWNATDAFGDNSDNVQDHLDGAR
ncbi:hypothetical protein ACFFJY_15210 [Fictibacillus aquaticus]|uniref:Uncharacterized protein n=1 Tax=Fictibacillus aquaticus TaxID=2021314 RepID=A0A235FE18_9BACL|nr:hypothetical protein [Fictibacillus aquaticus]OYD59561.1 hypothetical protein CGZ90_06625 [Fictibacillus aquaticus]